MSGKKVLVSGNGLGKSIIWREREEALKETYKKGKADGIAEANADHNVECGDCVRQITTADEARIRADERRKTIDELSVYILNSCKDVKCKEDITVDNDFDFYASELLEMLEQMKEQEAGEQNGN